jgi:hypothetical protein
MTSLHDKAKRRFASLIQSNTDTEVCVEYNIASRGQRRPDIFIPYGLDKVRKQYNRAYLGVEYSDNRTAAIEVKWSKSDVTTLESQLDDLKNRGIANLFGLVYTGIEHKVTNEYSVFTYDDDLNFYRSKDKLNIRTPRSSELSKSKIDKFVENEVSLKHIKEEWKVKCLTEYFSIIQDKSKADMSIWVKLVKRYYPHNVLYFNNLLDLTVTYNPYYYLFDGDLKKQVPKLVIPRNNAMKTIVKV